jgi:hypothetical protein
MLHRTVARGFGRFGLQRIRYGLSSRAQMFHPRIAHGLGADDDDDDIGTRWSFVVIVIVPVGSYHRHVWYLSSFLMCACVRVTNLLFSFVAVPEWQNISH